MSAEIQIRIKCNYWACPQTLMIWRRLKIKEVWLFDEGWTTKEKNDEIFHYCPLHTRVNE